MVQQHKTYNIVKDNANRYFIIEAALCRPHAPVFKQWKCKTAFKQSAEKLQFMKVADPFSQAQLPIILGKDNQNRLFYGSGVVAISPAFYLEDLQVALQLKLERNSYVDEKGQLSS